MHVPLLSSDWSTAPVDSRGTMDYHLDGLAQWLQSAGAEPRLALALCSGPTARAALHAAMVGVGIEVVATPVTAERPIHPDLMAHQGTHFNAKLFVVGGFEKTDAADAFRILDGQRKQLARPATWVLLLVESTQALDALYTAAPNLAQEIMRRCLIIGAEVVDTIGGRAAPAVRARWEREGHIAELVYADAMNPRTETDYRTFSRLVRSGYVSQLSAVSAALHPERNEMLTLWRRRERADGGTMTMAVAEGLVRHTAATLAQRTDATTVLVDAPAVRFAIGLDVSDAPFWGPLARVRDAADSGTASDAADWAMLRSDAAAQTLEVRVLVEWCISRAAAAVGDFDGCVEALERAVEWAHGTSREFRFELLEKAAQLYTFMEQPGAAHGALTALENEVPGLASPYYEGRLALMLGQFFGEKDAIVSQRFLRKAATLFGTHGYQGWADQARARLDSEQ